METMNWGGGFGRLPANQGVYIGSKDLLMPEKTYRRFLRRSLLLGALPDRTGEWAPKTLIFAKDDNHGEEIVHAAREVFGYGRVPSRATR